MKIKMTNIDPFKISPDRKDKFFIKFRHLDENECWNMKQDTKGRYSSIRFMGKQIKSHRFSYAAHYMENIENKYICHTCDNNKCVNPYHLFAGTQLDNVRDMFSKGRARPGNLGITHCWRGHEFDNKNTVLYTDNSTGKPKRYCKACEKIRDKVKIAKRKETRRDKKNREAMQWSSQQPM